MLRIDYANCLTDRVGAHGVSPALLEAGSAADRDAARAVQALARSVGAGMQRWRLLPHDPMRSEHLQRVRAFASERAGRFDNLLVLGIGGSALGNIALHAALNPATWNLLPADARPGPRLFVLDNVDPERVAALLDWIETHGGGLSRTLVNVISKSGETAETAAQFLILRDALARALGATDAAKRIVAITDPEKGTMRSICDREGYATLPVPEGVGGRFSVLSPVGLFSAAMCGVDIEALLAGAADMDRRCASPSLAENPAAVLASLLVSLARDKGKAVHVMLPYSDALFLLADWWRQLWAESLGKRLDREGREVFAGFTPVRALGATDQHSQIQLYREGPNDKVVCFLEVESFRSDVETPSGAGVEALAYLEGATLGALLNAEKRATEYALVESQRPNLTIRFPALDAHRVGQFLWLWQMATAIAGELLNVDAYDQPAVETGKQATFGLMGRAGFESIRSDVEGALAPTRFVV